MGSTTPEHWMSFGVNISLLIFAGIGIYATWKWLKNKNSDKSGSEKN